MAAHFPSLDDVAPAKRDAFNRVWDAPPGILSLIKSINNIPVSHKYMATGFMFFLTGGVMALFLRIQLGTPENTFLDPETYNQIFTMHGTTMMFLFVIPFIEAFANYMLPLLLGSRDLPFPRLTAFAFWTYFFGGIFLYSSIFFGVMPDGGWFAYVPLTNKEYSPTINMDYWDIGLSVAEIAALGAAAEMAIAILRMRAAGMTLTRLPLFAWAMLVTAAMILFAFTTLIVGTAMLELDRKALTAFFKPEYGGKPLLWQHLFWVFGHPEVYIMFVPAVGIVSHIVQTFSRRPIVSYPLMVVAIVSTGFLSFGLWVHHMFTTGLSATAYGFFAAASMIIAIPNGIQVFNWIATIWTGRPVWRTPMLFVAGFLVIFVLGGVTGIMVASVPFDAQVHDTYFVVAHLHYVLIGGVVFPLIAGLYYWLPKITGRLMSERLGKWNFWLMFVFFHVTFFPMHITGLVGMPRRIYTYAEGLGWDWLNLVSTIGSFGFAFGTSLFVVNFFWSLRRGPKAGADPWGGDTLEWSQASPPAAAQFPIIPVVRSRHPMWEQESLEAQDPLVLDQLDDLHWAPTRWRVALVVSVVDARPLALVQVPGPTAWPFVMSIGFVLIFAGALVESLWLFLAGAAITLVCLVGWFWPQEATRIAIEEIGEPTRPGKLPLAVAGPMSSGWWATAVFLMIMGTALSALVGAYFYLGEGPSTWAARDVPGTGMALVALAIVAAGAVSARVAVSAVRRGSAGLLRLTAVLTLVLHAAFVFPVLEAWQAAEITPATNAYDSGFAVMLGFPLMMIAVHLFFSGGTTLWALLRPADQRGHAWVHNTSLVSWFVLASWLVVLAVVYLAPRVL